MKNHLLIFFSLVQETSVFFTKVGEGICHGDSGGPLIYKGELVALVSWSYGCASGFPEVDTSVPYYYDWIIENAGPQEDQQ